MKNKRYNIFNTLPPINLYNKDANINDVLNNKVDSGNPLFKYPNGYKSIGEYLNNENYLDSRKKKHNKRWKY